MKERKHSNSEDAALFRDLMRDVSPLTARSRHPAPLPKRPRARHRRADERAVLAESLELPPVDELDPDDEMVYGRERLQRSVWRELRRGRIAVQAEIDLHGCTRAEAKPLLNDFIVECLARRIRCIRVVHGKGTRSGPGGPVIKNAVNRWLRRWDAVLAFCPAQRHHGGTGAVYVLLRAR